jgi:murein peptide amidase A
LSAILERENAIRSYPEVVQRLKDAGQADWVELNLLGSFTAKNREYPMYSVRLGKQTPDRLSVVLSAGIHGDEPAGVEAALRFIESQAANPDLLSRASFLVFPCDNPFGYEHNTRENWQGVDLNRRFRSKEYSPEVALIEQGIAGNCADLVFEMHEDYESPGMYLYEFTLDPAAYFAHNITQEVERMGYPINRARLIEHRRAKDGLIRPSLPNYRKSRLPKAIYTYFMCGGHVITLEAPSTVLPLEDRVRIELTGLNIAVKMSLERRNANR